MMKNLMLILILGMIMSGPALEELSRIRCYCGLRWRRQRPQGQDYDGDVFIPIGCCIQ